MTAVTSLNDGGVVSMVNELTERALLVLLLLVTVIVQLYVPSPRALKVIVLLSADDLFSIDSVCCLLK